VIGPVTESETTVNAAEVARCNQCFAYINPYAVFSRKTWRCTLCRAQNDVNGARYATAQLRETLPELRHALVEFSMDEEDEEEEEEAADSKSTASADSKLDQKHSAPSSTATSSSGSSTTTSTSSSSGGGREYPSSEYPAYIFCVDVSGRNEYLELVKASMLAALEALSPQVWVGLAVFSSKLGLYDLRSTVPHVRYIRIPAPPPVTASGSLHSLLSPFFSAFSACALPLAYRTRTCRHPPCTGASNPLGAGAAAQGVLSLSQVMALDDFVVRLGECKANLSAAIESLTSHYAAPPAAPAAEEAADSTATEVALAQPPPSAGATPAAAAVVKPKPRRVVVPQDQRKRGYGFAIRSLIEYVSGGGGAAGADAGRSPTAAAAAADSGDAEAGTGSSGGLLCVRILSFLSGIPNYGVGALDATRYTHAPVSGGGGGGGGGGLNVRAAYKQLMSPQTPYYRQTAERAARAGVCLDVYVVSELSYTDCATLKHLTLLTGGHLLLYELSGDAALPQDLFRQLKRAQVFRGLLRVRTSPEFAVASVYGHCIPDATYEQLFHCAGFDTRKVLALDFEFTSVQRPTTLLPSPAFPSHSLCKCCAVLCCVSWSALLDPALLRANAYVSVCAVLWCVEYGFQWNGGHSAGGAGRLRIQHSASKQGAVPLCLFVCAVSCAVLCCAQASDVM
jgi:hypothetical protein